MGCPDSEIRAMRQDYGAAACSFTARSRRGSAEASRPDPGRASGAAWPAQPTAFHGHGRRRLWALPKSAGSCVGFKRAKLCCPSAPVVPIGSASGVIAVRVALNTRGNSRASTRSPAARLRFLGSSRGVWQQACPGPQVACGMRNRSTPGCSRALERLAWWSWRS